MWNTLSKLITNKNRKKMDKIEIGSEMVECQKQIAENLNRYFVKSINKNMQLFMVILFFPKLR